MLNMQIYIPVFCTEGGGVYGSGSSGQRIESQLAIRGHEHEHGAAAAHHPWTQRRHASPPLPFRNHDAAAHAGEGPHGGHLCPGVSSPGQRHDGVSGGGKARGHARGAHAAHRPQRSIALPHRQSADVGNQRTTTNDNFGGAKWRRFVYDAKKTRPSSSYPAWRMGK